MNLIELSLKRPVFAWVLMASLIVFGAVSLKNLGVSQMPDVNFPVLTVSVNYPGAAPEVVESEILDLLEKKLLAVEGIKEMRSSASQGSASITLEFAMNRSIDVALQEVQTALSQVRLPTGVDPAVIQKKNPEEDPILIVSLSGDENFERLMRWTQDYFVDQIQFIPGVGEVSLGGFPDRNLRVWIDADKLKKFDLTVGDILEAIRSQHMETAAGQFVDGKNEIRVRYLGEAKSIEEMENFPIQKRGGQIIQDQVFHIKDVATVIDGLDDIRRMGIVNGQRAVVIRVQKQRGTNEVELAQTVIKKLTEIKYPAGIKFKVNVNYTQSTQATVDLTIEKLWVAALITILVCFLFLGSFQSAVNILFSIPTSILGTFIILKLLGFTLNLFTLLALTLSISIVVDDAIMILENIVRHYRMGKNSYQAALDGAVEVIPAAVAATLAVLAVFMPVIFMEGVVGQFLFQFGITMSAAVCLSLLEAITITPMRSAALLRSEPKLSRLEIKLDSIFEKASEYYRYLLQVSIKFKWWILAGSLVFFVFSLKLIPSLKQEFVPTQDQNLIILTAQAKPGTSLQATEQLVKPIEKIMSEIPEISGYLLNISPAQLFMPINLKDLQTRTLTHQDIMNKIREKTKLIKGLRVSMRDISSRNLTTGKLNPIAFNLRGPDLKVLNEKAQNIMKQLEDKKLATDLNTDYQLGLSELGLVPNRDQLMKKGVSVDSVSQVLQTAVAGLRAGQFMSDGHRQDIRFKVREDQIKNVDDIKKLYVRNNYGNIVALKDLVIDQEKEALQSISRINRQRSISVFGNLAPQQSQAQVLKLAQEISEAQLDTGYSFNLEGASAGFSSSFKNLYWTLLLGILVAYMILAVQFNSFRDPIAVLMSLPFSVSGAILILWSTQISLNLFSFIGLIVLMGIAKKNSIMLIEFTTQMLHRKQLSYTEAILEACPVRLRPILMTSVATIFAAAPLIFGHGLGHETRKPMGLVIIGGTIVSTIFTLFVVPLFYLAMRETKFFKKS